MAEQAQSLRDGLAGISEEDRKVLDGKAGHDDLRSAQTGWLRHIEVTQENLASLVESLDSSLEDLELPASAPASLTAEANALLTTARDALLGLRSTISGLETEFNVLSTDDGAIGAIAEPLSVKATEYSGTNRAVKQRSLAHEAKLAERARLEEQQRKALELVQRQRTDRQRVATRVTSTRSSAPSGPPHGKNGRARCELSAKLSRPHRTECSVQHYRRAVDLMEYRASPRR